ncbi:MAG: hypothetical protein WC095_02275 [Candidatus Paceibacterota bacterium]
MKKNLVLGLILLVILISGGFYYFRNTTNGGCSVFGCLDEEEVSNPGLNDSVVMGDIIITPEEILEDSRCPLDVTCVWAGVLSVKVKLQNVNDLDDVVYSTLNLTNKTSFNGKTITIKSVEPLPYSGSEISSKDYKFEFALN